MYKRLNITLSDEVLERADEFAERERYTRSGLIAAALEAFVAEKGAVKCVVAEAPAPYGGAREIAGRGKAEPNRAIYIAALRAMTDEQRLLKALELSEMTHDALRAGLRERFPDASEEELRWLYLEAIERCRRRNAGASEADIAEAISMIRDAQELKSGDWLQVLERDGCYEFIPVRSAQELRGFLKDDSENA